MHLKALTSLRFVAAAAILVFHTLPSLEIGDAYPSLALGVSFFFVLSGFVLAYSYGQKPRPWGEFLTHRFARVWPLHAVTAVLAMVMMTGWPGLNVGAANLSLLHAWVPLKGYVFSVNPVSWSISAEAFFYAMFPAILLAKRPGWLLTFIGALSLVVVLIAGIGVEYISSPDPWGYSAHQVIHQGPIVRLFEFAFGVVAGRIFLTGFGRDASASVASALQVASVALVLSYAASSGPVLAGWPFEFGRTLAVWYNQSGGFLAFALLIYAFALPQGTIARAISGRVMVRLGEISFALYMVHILVLHLLNRSGIVASIGPVGAFVSAVTLSLVSAYILWWLVEVPARRLIVRSPIVGRTTGSRQTA